MRLNNFSCDIRDSYIVLPDGNLTNGPVLHLFLHPLLGLCALSRCSALEVPPCLLPEGFDCSKPLSTSVIPLPDLDWSHPFIVDLKAQCIQNWLTQVNEVRAALHQSETELRAMLREAYDAHPF